MISDSARQKKFWKGKIAAPVLLSQVSPGQNAKALQNRIYHNGFFHNTVNFDTIPSGNYQAKYLYNVVLNQPYGFATVKFPDAGDDLSIKISLSRDNTLIVPGDLYSLETIQDERNRISQFLKLHGYIYFNPEFLFLQADSVSEDHKVNVEIKVKPDTPSESRTAFSIDKIYVYDNHSLENYQPDTLNLDPYFFLSPRRDLRHQAIMRGLFLEPGKLYSSADHTQTSRYLNRLPIMRSTSIRFSPGESPQTVDTHLFLTKRKQFGYSAEFNTIFRSTNYFGPGIIFSFTNRNVREKAEQLQVNLRGRFEMQIDEGSINPAYELGLELNYSIPRLRPSVLSKLGKRQLPRTTISTGYNLFNRLDLYRLNSVFLDFGYRWNKNDIVSHRLDPLGIVFTSIPETSKSDEFNDYLEQNPGVRQSFEEQFVVGSGYEFTYDPNTTGRSEFFFRGGLDLAGNLLYGAYNVFNAEKDSLGSYNLFGVPFSQYIRTRVDVRYGYHLSNNSSLVTRFIVGVGLPFGNSDILPYIKQFYVGGTNSLRSFIARSIGPGSEVPPEGFRDLTGDMRLEWNMEYRFTIAGNLKSALFLDVGNVWLYKEDPSRPKGTFKFNSFLDDLAVSSGWGLRWDFDFVVARLDFAYTLRTPYLEDDEKWNKEINIWNPTFNIAIGYPF
jgi:outer membrane protein assembly factor BamA